MTNSKQHVLIIGFVWPEPNSSAAGMRMIQLVHLFISQNWKVTFASAASDSDYMFDFAQLEIDRITISLNDSGFDLFIKNLNPDIVLFDRFMIEEQFGWRVAENCPDAIRILDTEDLHSLRRARQQAFKEKREFTEDDLVSSVAKREVASILRCDLSLIISDVEMNILLNFFKVDNSLLHYIPFLLEPINPEDSSKWPTFDSRKNFITIGNFLHEPNWNAVLYLKEEIWPIIHKKLPGAEMHVYGAYPSQKVNELNKPAEGFFIKGRAENAAQVVTAARVCLAPLRFGAGIKGKLIEAMQCGTPSVTTYIGAEGMHPGLEWSGFIADDANGIAEAAVKLYTDQREWENAQKRGIWIINKCYSLEVPGLELIHRILEIKNNLSKHRHRNFTGAMLMHHTISGTKYMSKWIEEKNKA
ncbi:glycosyltransferase [Daejeonella oryzae]|uniref:glycosyltransferase n=1 Tax=Daejeonella oryzae TaxID=1122943 RepID=UPI0004272836|nr:glycosyltransferase [Daejeonella oryzae]